MGDAILRRVFGAALAVGFHAALGSAAGACIGDCNFDRMVEIDELITSVNIALGTEGIAACEGADGSLDDGVDIAELVAAVRNSMQGCGAERPEWRMLGGSLRRLFYNPRERAITRETAASLIPRWRYQTGAIVTGSPAVAWVELPEEGLTQMVFAASWDGNLYALRAQNGRPVWQRALKPQPGASYPYASSPLVTWLDGRQVVYIGGGMSMYCIDAATGALVWEFDAGTGCTTCGFPNQSERNEVESSPVVYNGLVFFGMDVNDTGGKGGMYAVRADDGRLAWYFDLATSATCRPFPEDNIRHFDGYHTAEQLGLPENFLSTRPGCDFDRTGNNCGNVWSSVSIDARRGLLYTASSNCDTDDFPETAEPPPPMPPYDRALFALRFDGTPAWVWRPSEVDNEDLSFGGVPNLFEVEIGGAVREVVGVGNKDGTYYVIDRDGVNEINGVSAADPPEIRNPMLPYWKTNVVPGGSQGGIIASAAVVPAEGKVFFSTAFGIDLTPQIPSAHALHLGDGAIAWQNPDVLPSFGPTCAVPGLAFMGTVFLAEINIFDSSNGTVLASLDTKGQIGGAASVPAVTGGMLFVGGGVGDVGGRPLDCAANPFSAYCTAITDTPISAFCLAGTPGCTDEPLCDDSNPCTYDFRQDGVCQSEPAPNTLSCSLSSVPTARVCRDGTCVAP